MRIAEVQLERSPDGDRLSGLVGDYRLWFRIRPGLSSAPTADAFVPVGLLAAMVRGEPLEVDAALTVSPRLVAALDPLQEVFSVWLPQLRRVRVSARTAPPAPAVVGTGSFFSGGVDSLYTYLRHQDEITHLIQIHGYDYRLENRALAEQAERANRQFTEARRRELVVVESNFRGLFEQHGVHIFAYHGAVLASVAIAVGLRRVYIPSSSTWSQLVPWGSHPVTDPLWSTESVELVHDGADAGRAGKLELIGRDQPALDLLRVCPRNDTYSCGVCEKCLRTRVCLRLLKLRSASLPPLDSTARIWRLALGSRSDRLMWLENLAAAETAGDRALARAIAFAVARFDVRRAVASLDRALLGGLARRSLARLGAALSREEEEPPVLRIDRDE